MWRQRAEQRLGAAEEEKSEFLQTSAADYKEERFRLQEEMQQNQIMEALFNPKVRLHRLGAEASGFLENTSADYEEEHCRSKKREQQNKILDAVFNPRVRLRRSVFPADVQQTVLIREEAAEEWRSDVDQQDGESLHIKLHRHQMGDGDLPTGCSADQIKATTGGEDCGGAESTRKTDPNTSEDDSSSLEAEVSEYEEDDEDLNDPDSQLKDLSDSGSEPEDSEKDWKESGAPESGVNTVNKSCSFTECERQFVDKGSPQRHVTCHSGTKSSSSLISKKCFRVKRTGDSGKKIQSRLSSFSCDDRGKRFSQTSDLNRHMRIHTGQKPFVCDHCGQRFREKSTLNTHMRIHTGQKPFVCDHCGQTFRQKSHFNTHMRIHTGQKPFVCDHCGHRFREKSTLNTHMRIHTGGKTVKL